MTRVSITIIMMLMAITSSAQENLQRGAITSEVQKTFKTIKEIPITSVKNQWRSGTCWDYATLGYFESEILRHKGIWYMSRDYIALNTTYLFLNRHALPKTLRKTIE